MRIRKKAPGGNHGAKLMTNWLQATLRRASVNHIKHRAGLLVMHVLSALLWVPMAIFWRFAYWRGRLETKIENWRAAL